MVASADGQAPTGPQLQSRPPLRISAGRQSHTGGFTSTSPKVAPHTPVRSSSGARTSSPGQLNTSGSAANSPTAALAASTSPGFGQTTSGDLPRLPCVSETGEKNPRPPAGVMLRRAATMNHVNLGRDHGGMAGAKESSSGAESVVTLKKERNALRIDKNALLLNKRRLEGLLSKLLEQPLPGETEAPPAGGNSAERSTPRSALLRASNMRAQLLKALDDSTGLERQLMATGGGGAVMTATSPPTLAESAGEEPQLAATVKEYAAKISQMQTEYDLAVKHFESELSYRRTQAAAAASSSQKQLLEAQEELAEAKHQLTEANTQLLEYFRRNEEMRNQLQSITSSLETKAKELTETKDLLGMDKATMSTVIEMLREQLRDANADRAAKSLLIKELEYAVVHRDTLLTEAHERINQAAAQAAMAAAAGVSSSAAVARVAASMNTTPHDTKGAWVMRTSNGGSHTISPQLSHRRIVAAKTGVKATPAGEDSTDNDLYMDEKFET